LRLRLQFGARPLPAPEPSKSLEIEVPSPCIRLCLLNTQQICTGCGRHIDEIAVWSGAGPERRRQIRAESARLLAALQGAAEIRSSRPVKAP
jgi:uncharacterized protein